MDKAEVVVVFDYLYWMRDRILDAASQLSPAEFTSAGTVVTRDLRATLVHELDVQWSWRTRLRTGSFGPEDDLAATDYQTVDQVADHWRRDEAEMRSWIAGLTDSQLGAAPPGEESPLPLSYYVLHLLSHAIQQFSEAAVLLTRFGHSPGDIGFLEFARKQ